MHRRDRCAILYGSTGCEPRWGGHSAWLAASRISSLDALKRLIIAAIRARRGPHRAGRVWRHAPHRAFHRGLPAYLGESLSGHPEGFDGPRASRSECPGEPAPDSIAIRSVSGATRSNGKKTEPAAVEQERQSARGVA